jgi:uncharacterized protein
LPTRMSFSDLPPELRPNSEAAGNTRSDAGANLNPDLIPMVIERWRSATAHQRTREFEAPGTAASADALGAQRPSAPPPPQAPSLQPAPRPDALRSSLLKRPLDEAVAYAPTVPPQRMR